MFPRSHGSTSQHRNTQTVCKGLLPRCRRRETPSFLCPTPPKAGQAPRGYACVRANATSSPLRNATVGRGEKEKGGTAGGQAGPGLSRHRNRADGTSGTRSRGLFPRPGAPPPAKPSSAFFPLSFGAMLCCSSQRHAGEENARGGGLQGPGASAEPQIYPLRRAGGKNKKLESVLANAPMQKSKLYSLLFIYLTILKYLLLASTKMKNIGALHSL